MKKDTAKVTTSVLKFPPHTYRIHMVPTPTYHDWNHCMIWMLQGSCSYSCWSGLAWFLQITRLSAPGVSHSRTFPDRHISFLRKQFQPNRSYLWRIMFNLPIQDRLRMGRVTAVGLYKDRIELPLFQTILVLSIFQHLLLLSS